VDFGDDSSADQSFDRSTFSSIEVFRSGSGRFRVDQIHGAIADEALTVHGAGGHDTLDGGDGAELFDGGSGRETAAALVGVMHEPLALRGSARPTAITSASTTSPASGRAPMDQPTRRRWHGSRTPVELALAGGELSDVGHYRWFRSLAVKSRFNWSGGAV
jgi:hypothetical protein